MLRDWSSDVCSSDLFWKKSPFLDQGIGNFCDTLCSFIHTERGYYGWRHNHTPNGGDSLRHVAETGFYRSLGRFLHTSLPKQEIQEHRRLPALLRQNESYKLPLSVRHRSFYLFPGRSRPGLSLRIHDQLAGRNCHLPYADNIFWLVVMETPARPLGTPLAQMDMVGGK